MTITDRPGSLVLVELINHYHPKNQSVFNTSECPVFENCLSIMAYEFISNKLKSQLLENFDLQTIKTFETAFDNQEELIDTHKKFIFHCDDYSRILDFLKEMLYEKIKSKASKEKEVFLRERENYLSLMEITRLIHIFELASMSAHWDHESHFHRIISLD